MSVSHHESILETIFDEVVEESLSNMRKAGFVRITESDLDMKAIEKTVYKRFEDLCQ
tara:strand:+ start:814 stop:984 length:171 start_codon:yes stop_codon:yes gene_type:complete